MKKYNIVFGLFVFVFSFSVFIPQKINANWVAQTNINPVYFWEDVASSGSGTTLYALNTTGGFGMSAFNGVLTGGGGVIFKSTDGGVRWDSLYTSAGHNWIDLDVSDSGNKIIAVPFEGYIHTSTNGGYNWVERKSAGYRSWRAVASSADGNKLVAATHGYHGYIYTSTDGGETWTERKGAGSHNWSSVASSFDGNKLVAVPYSSGYVYTSIDGGATWTERTSAGKHRWTSVASSSDGNKLVAVEPDGGYVYTSIDGGATWIERKSFGEQSEMSVASSADGNKLAICSSRASTSSDSVLYLSNDGGVSWIKQTGVSYPDLTSIDMSSNGNKLVAVPRSSETIFTYNNNSNFTTPSLSTQPATQVSKTFATLNGNITSIGGSSITSRGFNYGKTINYGSTTTETGSYSIGSFTKPLSPLNCGTTYHYRSYAKNSSGTSYGENQVFTTSPCDGSVPVTGNVGEEGGGATIANTPVLISPTVSSITQTSAKLGANITSIGTSAITARGTCYGTSPSPTTNCLPDTSRVTGTFTQTRTGLTPNTTYYYRGYATNSSGTGYSTDGTFTTLASVSTTTPTLTTGTAQVTSNTITLTGNITSTGGTNVTTRGFEYGLTNAYGKTLFDTGSFSTGSFTKEVPSKTVITLPCGVTYYYRSYAINSSGTGYGDDKVFSTAPCGTTEPVSTTPSLTTQRVSDITETSATLIGSITSTGGDSVTTRGFEYGTTTDYGMNTLESGSFNVGSFSVNITGLSCATTYHYRSYASNPSGKGFGGSLAFTTSGCAGKGLTGSAINAFDGIVDDNYTTPSINENKNKLNINRNLSLGMIGEDVKLLQEYLNTHGYTISFKGHGSKGNETNEFGKRTLEAVKAFQKDNGLIPDGIVGIETLGVMR